MKIELTAQKDNTLINEILTQKPQLNYNQLKSLLRKKDIKVNQKRQKNDIFVTKNDKIEIFLQQKQKKQVETIFEDNNILIVFKPAGMETTKQDKVFLSSDCLEDIVNFKPCHRLDKNTEGLVVFAKTEGAYNDLLTAFKKGNINKKYYALVTGKVKSGTQKLEDYLVKHSDKNYVEVFDSKVENSVKILTNYKVVKQFDDLFLLDIELLTGKTHQIRAHLAHHGIYVVGDNKYGNKQINKFYKKTKQQLCAYFLKFSFENSCPLSYLNNKVFSVEPTFKITTKTL